MLKSIHLRTVLFGTLALLGFLLGSCSQPAGGETAGFTLSLSSNQLNAAAGATAPVTLSVSCSGGFSGQVDLSLTASSGGEAPAGVSLDKTSVTVPGGPYQLEIEVAPSVAPGSYALTLVGKSGSLTRSVNFTLTVEEAGLTIALDPPNLSVPQGGAATTTLKVTPPAGYSGELALSLTNAAGEAVPGLTLTPASLTVSGETQQTLTLQAASSLALGEYALKLHVSAGEQSAEADLALTVTGYALQLSSEQLFAPQGGQTTVNLLVDAAGVSGTMSLALQTAGGDPPPAGLSLQPDSVSVPGGPQTLTLGVDAAVATGEYDLQLLATLNGVQKTVAFSLTVQPPPEFTASISPDSLTVAIGDLGNIYYELSFLKDVNDTINLYLQSADGSAAPAGVSLSPNSIEMVASSGDVDDMGLTIAVDDSATAGTYPLRIRAQSTNTTADVYFTLTIPTPPDFTLDLSATSLTVIRGGAGEMQLQVTPHNGFAGTVQLALVDQYGNPVPSGVTLEPSSVDLSSGAVDQTVTIGVDQGVTIDRYYLAVEGSNGDDTQSANFTLIVEDFSLNLGTTAPTLTVDEGSSGSLGLTINISLPDSLSSFPGPVELGLASQDGSPLPAGLSVSPASVEIPSGTGSVNATVTVATTGETPPGNYDLLLTGSAAGVVRSAAFTLTVRGFTLDLSSPTLAFWTGGSGQLDLTITPEGGFSGTVDLSLEDASGQQPAGLTLSPTSVSVSAATTQTLTISDDGSLAAGAYPLRLKAVSGNIVRYAEFTLYLQDFDISLDSGSLSIQQGEQGTLELTVTPSGDYAGTLNLYMSAASGTTGPTGVSLSPTSVSVSGVTSQTLTFSATSSASPGRFDVLVVAEASLGGVQRTRTAAFTLDLTGMNISLSVTGLGVARGGSRQMTLTVDSYGVNDLVSLALTGQDGAAAPSGINLFPESVNVSDGTQSFTLTVSTEPTIEYGDPKNYYLSVAASWGALTKNVDFDLSVYRVTRFWLERESGTSYDINDVIYANGTFVAVSNGIVLVSTGGVTWQASDSDTFNSLFGIAYDGSTFVAVGDACEVSSSTDGLSWTQQATPDSICSVTLRSLAYDSDHGVFVAVGDSGTILYSYDQGDNWTQVVSNLTENLYRIIYAGGQLVAVGENGLILTSSDGGQTWSNRTSGTSNTLHGIAYGYDQSGNGVYVAVGEGGVVVTSSDGATWSAGSLGTTYDAYDVVYGYDQDNVGIFVAVVNYVNNQAYTSEDGGQTWSANNGSLSATGYAAAYGNHTYVLVGESGAISTSP